LLSSVVRKKIFNLIESKKVAFLTKISSPHITADCFLYLHTFVFIGQSKGGL